nr:ribonuclease H-like domain-containing protein [Tanacetum cinerariifolium]
MAGLDDEIPPPPPLPQIPTQQAPHTASTIKLLILKKGLQKGYDRFHSLLSQLEIHGAGVSTKDANKKYLRSLPASWSQASLIMRTKPGVDTLSFNDVYNNLKVFDTNEASTAYGVSTSSGHNSQREGSSSYTDELIQEESCSLMPRNQLALTIPKSSALIVTRQGILLESADQRGIKILGGEIHETLGINQKTMGEDLENRRNLKLWFMKINLDDKTDVLTYHKKLLAEAKKEKEELKAKIEKWQNSSKGLNNLLDSQMRDKDKSRLGYGNQIHKGILSYENEVFRSVFNSKSSDIENSPVNDRYAERMHAIPLTMTGIYMPPISDFGIDELMFTYGPKQSKTSESDAETSNFASCESNSSVETLESIPKLVINEPEAISDPKVWSDAPIIEEYESDSDDEHVTIPSKEQEKPSLAFVNTVKNVKTFRQTIKEQNTYDPQKAFKNKGIVDSRCSRHMTGNKAYLVDYQDYNGGLVAFGGSKGHITCKGKIRTGKLDFKDMCFMKELQHFNLFFVSQMCDKKNKVLFTDTECLVMSPDFKLPDENQVLLRVPRQNNIYSFNLENIVSTGGLACLIAKAVVDESNKWHRRLGHVNFKNLTNL